VNKFCIYPFQQGISHRGETLTYNCCRLCKPASCYLSG